MKKYCTQNNGDCLTCSLVNYGRDCKNNPLTGKYPDMTAEEILNTVRADLREADNTLSAEGRKEAKEFFGEGFDVQHYIIKLAVRITEASKAMNERK
jgi:hypothetical protein